MMVLAVAMVVVAQPVFAAPEVLGLDITSTLTALATAVITLIAGMIAKLLWMAIAKVKNDAIKATTYRLVLWAAGKFTDNQAKFDAVMAELQAKHPKMPVKYLEVMIESAVEEIKRTCPKPKTGA